MNRLFTLDINNRTIGLTENSSVGHELGQCLLEPDARFCYVNIPKNASSELSKLFHRWIKVTSGFAKNSECEYIVVLRDPTDRWISGLAEFLAGDATRLGRLNAELDLGEFEKIVGSKFFQNFIFDQVIFDSHTLPQTWFLQGLELDQIKFFYMDDQVVNRIADYTKVNLDQYEPSRSNNSLTNTKKQIIIKQLKLLLQDPELGKIIDTHYYADHQLFDCVKFQY